MSEYRVSADDVRRAKRDPGTCSGCTATEAACIGVATRGGAIKCCPDCEHRESILVAVSARHLSDRTPLEDPTQDLAARVERIRWRVPVTEYIGNADGYMATCSSCADWGLTCAWQLPSQAAVNRWVSGHRQWHQTTRPGGERVGEAG